MKNLFQLLLFFAMPLFLSAQNIDQYRWENRLILVFTPNVQHPTYLQQVAELAPQSEALADRKLLLFTFTPQGQLLNEDCLGPRENSLAIYDKYGISTTDYTVLLIGLDGGVKRKVRNEVVNPQSFFKLIDTMPMRRAELRRRNQGKRKD
ncbi:MAG: DUF4174 domain-containing protein [Bacteroidota bacterium]